MINWIMKLFGYEIVKVGQIDELNEQLSEKSQKINKYYKEWKDVSFEFNLLLDHFNEVQTDLNNLQNNEKYFQGVITSINQLEDLLSPDSLRSLNTIISQIQIDILKETARSNMTELDLSYRSGAIDITNVLMKKLGEINDQAAIIRAKK